MERDGTQSFELTYCLGREEGKMEGGKGREGETERGKGRGKGRMEG